jgi:cold shock CspA family protein
VKNYQIVNGCQTSHILYQNRSLINDQAFVPIKLIVADDDDVVNQIIKATNRQTEVKVEAFESLQPFQKRLEEVYLSYRKDDPAKLYYERRSKQYVDVPVPKTRVISLAAQVKCFIAMFLNEPHSTHRYYGELINSYRSRLFDSDHSPYPYFVSGLALVTAERLFREEELPARFKLFKYHLIMFFRYLIKGDRVPRMNSKGIDSYCQILESVLREPEQTRKLFLEGIDVVGTCLVAEPTGAGEATRTRTFTERCIAELGSRGVVVAEDVMVESPSRPQQGRVKMYDDARGFGFIDGCKGTDYFFHVTKVATDAQDALAKGVVVEFTTEAGRKGVEARVRRVLGR